MADLQKCKPLEGRQEFHMHSGSTILPSASPKKLDIPQAARHADW